MSESVFKNPFDVIDDEVEVNASKYEIPIETEQALKKIAKRGTETRTKGFKELVQSLKSLPKEHLAEVAVLLRSSFVAVFNKYVFEPEKYNRAALGEVLRLLVSAADLKNFLAPILKDILLNWLLAMYDSVTEVASTYRKAFETAFPGTGAVDKLLERFKDTITEQVMQFLKGEKWDAIKEVAIQVMGANEEEAAFVVELVKTELVGLCTLLNAKNILKVDDIAQLLMQDKTFSAPRRLALYRLYKSTGSTKLRPRIVKLVSSESNPACLAFVIELLEDLKECVGESLFQSMFANLPDSSFEKLAKVAVDSIETVLNSIVKFVGHGSATIARERFDCIWSHFCAPKLSTLVTSDIVGKLLFDEKREFRTIGQLTAAETVGRLISVLPRGLVIEVLNTKPASCQKALILSKLDLEDDLSDCLSQLSLADLHRTEINALVTNEHVMKSISTSGCSLKDFVNILETLDATSAIQLLKDNNQYAFEEVLSLASKKLIKNVLLQQGNISITVKTVAAALESDLNVFDSESIGQSTLTEALDSANPHYNSPLVIELVKSKRLPNLSVTDNPKLLLDRLKVDADLFLHYSIDDEQYFPIVEFKCQLESDNVICDILLFKARSTPNSLLVSLSKFPLQQPENITTVATWCLLHGVPYDAPVKALPTSDNDWVNFALFKAGVSVFERKTTLSSAFANYQSLQEKSITEINLEFDHLLFPESEAEKIPLSVLQAVACLEPILPLKSDKLAALIDDSELALLLVALHAKRSELSREFWRCQWEEKLKTSVIGLKTASLEKEIPIKATVSLWNVLEAPEQEILPTFKEILLQMNPIDTNLPFEQSSLAQLFVIAAPFLQLSKDWLLEKFISTNSLSWLLALRGALLMFVMDVSLVAAQAKLSAEPNLLEEDCGSVLFPLFDCFTDASHSRDKTLVLLELFVSWCEGGKEDSMLQTAFHNVFKSKIYSVACSVLSCDEFCETFDFTPREFEAQELAAHLVYRLCAQFPLIMASACQSSDCSAKLAAREIDRIRRCPTMNAENVTIKLKPVLTSTTRVINLSVNFAGEIDLEISLQLPRLFPLEPVIVEGVKKSGLKESKWKSALLSLQAIFRSTAFNGNVLDAVKKWQANALKLFQGLEECAVCYSVVHPSDRSLPGPSCKQCKHRFHASCLYKWFKSSGNATCPLCRALF